MNTRAVNGKVKTLQEVLCRAIGPATAETTQQHAARAHKRDGFLLAGKRGLDKALHRVCGAPAAQERLSLRRIAKNRFATAGCRPVS